MKKIIVMLCVLFLLPIFTQAQQKKYNGLDDLNLSNIDSAQLTKVNVNSVRIAVTQPDKTISITKDNINSEIDRLTKKRKNLKDKIDEINTRIDSLTILKTRVEQALATP